MSVGGQRPFGTFPKIHQFWCGYLSCSTQLINDRSWWKTNLIYAYDAIDSRSNMRHLLILLVSSATGQVPIPTTCENVEKSWSFIHPTNQWAKMSAQCSWVEGFQTKGRRPAAQSIGSPIKPSAPPWLTLLALPCNYAVLSFLMVRDLGLY